ncbi:MAG: ComF family protein [Spirochaetales bacterium]|nr:ComF family protein [Spirochaetales bacterium]
MVRELIFQYKFNRKIYLADFFARSLAVEIEKNYSCFDWIVPLPSVQKIFYRRKHVTRIVKLLEKKYKLKVLYLFSSTTRRSQKSLDYIQRLDNLRGKIHLKKEFPGLKGSSVLLVDDIFTTGASSEECANLLLKNGVGKVEVLTLALD